MKYKMVETNTYVISLAPGEEIIGQLNLFLEQEKIQNAYFWGIGALKKAELAHYRVDTQRYSSKEFEEPLELADLTGNAFIYEDKPLVHAHATLANERFETYAGHLVRAIISSTCEIVLVKLNSQVQKKQSPVIGLKLLNI